MSDPVPQNFLQWKALTLDERMALVDHYSVGCRHCGRRQGAWTDSFSVQRCRACWGPVFGDDDEADVAA